MTGQHPQSRAILRLATSARHRRVPIALPSTRFGTNARAVLGLCLVADRGRFTMPCPSPTPASRATVTAAQPATATRTHAVAATLAGQLARLLPAF